MIVLLDVKIVLSTLLYQPSLFLVYFFSIDPNFVRFNTSCEYDDTGRVKKLTEVMQVKDNATESDYSKINETKVKEYTYDLFGRLLSEKITVNGSVVDNNAYTYSASTGRLSSVNMRGFTRSISYDGCGRYKSSVVSGTPFVSFGYTYDDYGNRKTKGYAPSGSTLEQYAWSRGHLLGGITFYDGSSTSYTYGYDGIRTKKVGGGVTSEYYYDGYKILGEDRSDGKKIRYLYDADGICGIRYYNGKAWGTYTFVKDIFGSVVMLKDSMGVPVARYEYDLYGNVTVTSVHKEVVSEDNGDIGELNPIRWRGHYYDGESGYYYIDGRYYDPWEGIYLDAIDIPTAISEMYLDRNGIMCDNILEFIVSAYTITTDLSRDPNTPEEEAEEGMPWWQWLIGGLIIAALAIATIVTGGASAGVAGFIVAGAFKGAVAGAISGALISGTIGGISSALSGDGFFSGFIDGAASGFMFGAIMGGITGAIGSGIRVIKAAKMWQAGTSYRTSTPFKTMVHHYKIHGDGFGNIVNYIKQASNFAIRNANSLSFVARNPALSPHWTWIGKAGINGHFTSIGKILTFWMK